jgi:hypothetical protein
LKGNGYALPAKAVSYFIVYACVASSFACMSFVHYLRILRTKKEGIETILHKPRRGRELL